MMKAFCILALCSALVSVGSNVQAGDLQHDIDNATRIIAEFHDIPEKAIPHKVLQQCHGLAILRVGKAALLADVRMGEGLVISKTSTGWSAPSAIGLGGVGVGLQAGAEIADLILVLNTDEAVAKFAEGGVFELGLHLGAAAGPVGREIEAGLTPAPVYAYSRSKGIYAGLAVEGTVIAERKEANARFYGRPTTPREILAGRVALPKNKDLYNYLSYYHH